MSYEELLVQYNKMSRRLHIYYILYNEKISDSIKDKIEKRVHTLLYARNEVNRRLEAMRNNNAS